MNLLRKNSHLWRKAWLSYCGNKSQVTEWSKKNSLLKLTHFSLGGICLPDWGLGELNGLFHLVFHPMFLGWSHSHSDQVRWLLSLASGGYTFSLVLNSKPIRPLAFFPTYIQARIDRVASSSCFKGPMTNSSLGLFHISSKCPLSLSPRSPCLVRAQITAHLPSVCISGLDTQSQFPFFPGPHTPPLRLLLRGLSLACSSKWLFVCLFVEALFSCMDQADLELTKVMFYSLAKHSV